jgi:hypothetical protein
MILYQILEEQPISIPTADGETFVDAILRGSRPAITEKSLKWKDLLDDLDELANGISAINAQAFWQYKGYAD